MGLRLAVHIIVGTKTGQHKKKKKYLKPLLLGTEYFRFIL